MTSTEIRNSFLKFFEERKHRIVPSASVIPYDDPTLLFTNAGMNQFKDVFLGTGKRDYVRAADSQKCIRVSGKHNDLEEVGRDTYHHTFFEMLGNWSFGDYYKKEAIGWAWELLTKVWGLEKKRLYATVFETDEEAEQLWKTVTDIDPTHVLRFGKKDNFWEMGETGPCGPCSEIHIDLTDDYSGGKLVNAGDARVMEIWNLVFIQYNRDDKGTLTPLPAKHVDTGMGFERICAVMQKKRSNYDTDVFMPIISAISGLTGKKYSSTLPTDPRSVWTDFDIAMRVVADHVRMLSFAIADGAVPSNTEGGYVLQKVLYRAARFGRILNMHEPFIYMIVDAVVESMGEAYPELIEKQSYIKRIIQAAEEKFGETQKNGLDYFYRNIVGEPIRQAYVEQGKIGKNWYVDTLRSDGNTLIFLDPTANEEITVNIGEELKHLKITTISGEDAFKLHDTYGVHIDTIEVPAKEVGLSIDKNRYEELMEEQRSNSRWERDRKQALKITTNVDFSGTHVATKKGLEEFVKDLGNLKTSFVGYEKFETEATVIVSDGYGKLVLDQTPFYGESGGQVGDEGVIRFGDNQELKVGKTTKSGNIILHYVQTGKELSRGNKIFAQIDVNRRISIMRNHTATHIVHEALRQVLGTHLHQQGSLVAPDHLRFDFNHFEKITPDQLRKIEDIVNEKIAEKINVYALNDPKEWLTIEQAKAKYPNVKMFFGDKYGDHVRIVEIDPKFSVELCGGTHVKNTKELGLFKIISESSVASGIRRIEAVTGDGLKNYIGQRIEKAGDLDRQIEKLLKEQEELQRQLGQFTAVESSKRPSLGSVELPTGEMTSDGVQVVDQAVSKREQTIEEITKTTLDIKKEISKFRVRNASSGIEEIASKGVSLNGFTVVSAKIDVGDAEELKSLGDTLRLKITSGVGVLGAIVDGKVALVCVVTDDLIKAKKLMAGKIVGELAKRVGGGGGGKPHLATAGGKDVGKLDEALRQTPEIVKSMLL